MPKERFVIIAWRFKSLDGKIHTLEQGLFFESATVATAAKEALLEMDNGNLHDVRIILKTLAGE